MSANLAFGRNVEFDVRFQSSQQERFENLVQDGQNLVLLFRLIGEGKIFNHPKMRS